MSKAVVRWAVVGVVVVTAALWLRGERHLVPEVWQQLHTAERGWLAVMLLAVVAAMVNLGMLHAAAQRTAGLDTRPLEVIEPAAAANTLNMITKSGGLAGLAPMAAHARRTGRAPAPVVAAYLLVAVVGQWTFAAVLAVTIAVVWASGDLTTAELVATGIFAVLVAVQVAVFAAAWRRSAVLERLLGAPARAWARMRRRPPPDGAALAARLAELHTSVQLFRDRPARCVPVVAHGFGVEAIGVAELTAAIAATGNGIHVGTALVAYSVGVLFAIVGVVPGGLGLVEVSATGVLVASGMPVAQAAAAVVLFRVAELWIPVVLGGLAAMSGRRSSVTA